MNPLPPDLQAMIDHRNYLLAHPIENYRPLNMYAIFREDLDMTAGKLAAQAGHAFEMTYAKALIERPEITNQYKGHGNGTKICMYAKNLGQLERAYRDCLAAGIPAFLIIDSRHIMPPHFDGKPIFTCLGIGPAYKDEIMHITKRYTMIK
jgi:peptidyl-tRNA hydrolase